MEYENYGAGYAVYYGKMTATFETYWNSDEFQVFHVEQEDDFIKAIDHERGREGSGKNQVAYQFDIKPYPYQQAILDALEAERKQKNHWKNLVVAATGTGKTAISALTTEISWEADCHRPQDYYLSHIGKKY